MTSPVMLRSVVAWTDDTKLAMTKLERQCNSILATLTYLKRVWLTRAAHSQLESVQYLLISQHSEMTSSVYHLCRDLYRKHSNQFEQRVTAANSALADLCCWLDRRFLRPPMDARNGEGGCSDADFGSDCADLLADYREKITEIIDACQHPRINSHCRERLRSSLPSDLDRCLDDDLGVLAGIADAGERLRSMHATASTVVAAAAAASASSSGDATSSNPAEDELTASSSSSASSASRCSSSGPANGNQSEESTQTEEEVTEEMVTVNGVLYKRRIRRRRRQKVVRTRTVVTSLEPPLVGGAAPPATASPAISPSKIVLDEPGDGPQPKSAPAECEEVVLRRPEAADQQVRLVTQYMQALGSFDRELIDFSRHSAVESFDHYRARWQQLLADGGGGTATATSTSSGSGAERTHTVCLVSEQRQLEPGLFVQRSATVSRTVRHSVPPHCQEDLGDLLVWDSGSAESGEDRICVRGGPLDALTVYACLPGNDRAHILFCESFAATYPCFTRPADLIAKIVARCLHFKGQANKGTLWKSAFAFLIRVLDESTLQDRQCMLLDPESAPMKQLAALKQRLLSDGNTPEVQLLTSALHCLRQRPMSEMVPADLVSASATPRRRIVEFSPRQVAEQITLLDARLYRRIDVQEFLAFVRARPGEQFANLQAFINFFNRLGFWAKTLVLGRAGDRMRDRERQLSFFCKVAEELRRHNNFNSHLAIVLSLVSLDRLPWPGRSVRRKLKDFTGRLANQAAFAREYFRNMSTTEPPLVPHVGEVLKYLTRIHEGVIGNDEIRQLPPNYPVERARTIGPVINYWKYWMSFNCLDFCIKFKRYTANAMYYDFQPNEEILSSIDNFNEALTEGQLAQLELEIRQKYTRPK